MIESQCFCMHIFLIRQVGRPSHRDILSLTLEGDIGKCCISSLKWINLRAGKFQCNDVQRRSKPHNSQCYAHNLSVDPFIKSLNSSKVQPLLGKQPFELTQSSSHSKVNCFCSNQHLAVSFQEILEDRN